MLNVQKNVGYIIYVQVLYVNIQWLEIKTLKRDLKLWFILVSIARRCAKSVLIMGKMFD